MKNKKVIAFFACEAGNGGKELGWELRTRLEKLCKAINDPKFDGATVLIVSGAAGFNPMSLYSELVTAYLRTYIVVPLDVIVVPYDTRSTADEIDAFENWARYHKSYDIWAASSDYHMERIRRLWEIRHGRKVGSILLCMPRTLYIRKRMLLEYPKNWLLHTPAWFQSVLGQVMRRLKLI